MMIIFVFSVTDESGYSASSDDVVVSVTDENDMTPTFPQATYSKILKDTITSGRFRLFYCVFPSKGCLYRRDDYQTRKNAKNYTTKPELNTHKYPHTYTH